MVHGICPDYGRPVTTTARTAANSARQDEPDDAPGMPTAALSPVIIDLLDAQAMAELAMANLRTRLQSATVYIQELRRQAGDPSLLAAGQASRVSRATGDAPGRAIFGSRAQAAEDESADPAVIPVSGNALASIIEQATKAGHAAEPEQAK